MINWPNLFLVAGTGRNVGKTTFVCDIIKRISQQQAIIAIKITPHLHNDCNHCKTLYQSDNLIISEETSNNTGKDSTKMLKSGAEKVYYIQGADNVLDFVAAYLIDKIPGTQPIICESAGLVNFVKSGLFVVMQKSSGIAKNDYLKRADNRMIIDFEYDVSDYLFKDGKWY